MKMFARITKVDEAKRLVYGRMTQEVVDKAGEILDYEKSKPYFKAWSDSFMNATDGKSFGNVRAMHGKVAAGKLAEPIVFNDAEKAMDIVSKITDDNEWAKCLDGTYTGYSIGGGYVGERVAEKSADGRDVHRYVANPAEVSLVDNPCLETAKFFDVIKSDGAVEKVEFKIKEEPIEVVGKDEEVAEFAKALNDAGLTLSDAIGLVKAKVNPVPLTFEQVLAELTKAIQGEPDALKKRLEAPEISMKDFRDEALKVMSPDEFKAIAAEPIEKQIEAVVQKAGMTAANKDRLQAAHDHIAAMGASCGTKAEETTGLQKAFDEQSATLKAVSDRLEKLEKQPMPHPIRLRAVTKEDSNKNEEDKKDEVTHQSFDDLVKFADGTINWDESRRKLEERLGAAA